jgi:hypothetical protein
MNLFSVAIVNENFFAIALLGICGGNSSKFFNVNRDIISFLTVKLQSIY